MDTQENHPSRRQVCTPRHRTTQLRIRTNPEDPSFIQVNISLAGVQKREVEVSRGMDGQTTMPANPPSPDR